MRREACCSYAAVDDAWIAWADSVHAMLCEPISLGLTAPSTKEAPADWISLPGGDLRQVRFLPRANPEMPDFADLCLQFRCGEQIRIWDEAWLRPEKGRTWEGIDSCMYEADRWTIAVRAADAGGRQAHLFSVREDGFACLRAGSQRGVLLTKPILCTADALALNCATSAAGSVRVGVLTQKGQPISKRSTEDCDLIYGNSCRIPVTFRGQRILGGLTGQWIRLKFELQDAELYAFRFCTPE